MEIILTKAVRNLGGIGDVVKVADGYARNYLIPKGLAVIATPQSIKAIDRRKKQEELKKSKDLRKAQELAKIIRKMSCTIVKQVSEGDRLFGSVTVTDIIKSLENEGVILEKKQVILEEPIKSLGIHPVKIRLAPQVESVLKVWVVK